VSLLDEIRMTGRYVLGLPAFLRRPLSPAGCEGVLKNHLAARASSFLQGLERAVFARSRSPYRALFNWAGIGFEDVKRLVRERGVEGALERLHEAGVSVKLEEFKGRKPIERNGRMLPVQAEDFDNPLVRAQFEGRTGGSRGSSRRLLLDLDLLTHDAACHYLYLAGFDLLDRPLGVWRPVPPDNSGIKKLLLQAKLAKRVDRWFSQTPLQASGGRLKYYLFTRQTLALCHVLGSAQASPEHTPFASEARIAEWLHAQARGGRAAQLDTLACSAVRVCLAARERGLDITGTHFRVGGESLTPAKVRFISEMGSRVVCHYAMSESGPLGMACATPNAIDDVHVLQSKAALIQRADGAILATSLLPASPKLMINVETGDSGVLERRTCGCPLGDIGFDLHLHGIRSYEKLTAEGIQFLGSELAALLEEVLPAAFGGSLTDYQLVEQEQQGLSKVSIVASLRVGALDEAKVVKTALEFLARHSVGHQLMAKFWEEGHTLGVVRREPYTTAAGKILPLHILT
jgi:hypothetical protein